MSQSCEPVFLFRDEVHFSYHVSVPLHGRLDVNRHFFEGEVEVVLPYIRYLGTLSRVWFLSSLVWKTREQIKRLPVIVNKQSSYAKIRHGT